MKRHRSVSVEEACCSVGLDGLGEWVRGRHVHTHHKPLRELGIALAEQRYRGQKAYVHLYLAESCDQWTRDLTDLVADHLVPLPKAQALTILNRTNPRFDTQPIPHVPIVQSVDIYPDALDFPQLLVPGVVITGVTYDRSQLRFWLPVIISLFGDYSFQIPSDTDKKSFKEIVSQVMQEWCRRYHKWCNNQSFSEFAKWINSTISFHLKTSTRFRHTNNTIVHLSIALDMIVEHSPYVYLPQFSIDTIHFT